MKDMDTACLRSCPATDFSINSADPSVLFFKQILIKCYIKCNKRLPILYHIFFLWKGWVEG
jgi:hypothetical protein